ncbi:hypothetical protein Hte_000006 [Hypoxylon texense]
MRKSQIKDFFEQLIAAVSGSGKLSCADLNQFFFPKAPAPGTCQYNFMQPVWDGIASDKNLYFVAMSQFLNGAQSRQVSRLRRTYRMSTESQGYQNSESYDWDYTFEFKWDRNNRRQEGEEESSDKELTCPFPSSSRVSTASSTPASAPESEITPSKSDVSSRTSSGPSSIITSTNSTSTRATSSRITSALSTRSTSVSTRASTRSSTSSHSSTAQPSRRTSAPDITIPTPSDKPDCNQGHATYTLFYIPEADDAREEWEFDLMPNGSFDPETNVESWSVGTKAKEPLASGKGGKDMEIKWKAPEEAPDGTYVELVFANPDPPLGNQTFGVVAKGGSTPCMPDSCCGPPKVVSDDNGKVCKKMPCSTSISCAEDGPITPRADCLVVEDGAIVPLWYDITVITNNFIVDGGSKLREEEKGCGALASWKRHDINTQSEDGSWTAVNSFSFTLPMTIKDGCVERAIASAGGPEGLICVNSQSDWVFI